MTVQAALGTYLQSFAGLVSLVGTRIYPVRATEDSQQYIVFRFAARTDNNPLTSPSPVAEATVEISAFANDYDMANQIAEQIRLAMVFYQGQMAGAAGVYILSCSLKDMRDEDVPSLGVYEVMAEYQIAYGL